MQAYQLDGKVENLTRKEVAYMTVYETFTLLIHAGLFLLALLVYIETKNAKK